MSSDIFPVAESMGFKGDFRQWAGLLRVGFAYLVGSGSRVSRRRKPFCYGARDAPQGCHDRFPSRLLRQASQPRIEEAKGHMGLRRREKYSRSSLLVLQAFYCQHRAHPGN